MDKEYLVNRMISLGLAKFQPEKPFTLASGAESPWYFDVKSALMFRETRKTISDILNMRVENNVVAGGPANAAYLLVSQLYFTERCFVVRKAEKDHGIVGKIDGWPPNKGDSVVLLEDVITTGGSLLPAIKYVEEREANLKAIIVVVDRNENDQLGEYRRLVRPITTKEDFLSRMRV